MFDKCEPFCPFELTLAEQESRPLERSTLWSAKLTNRGLSSFASRTRGTEPSPTTSIVYPFVYFLRSNPTSPPDYPILRSCARSRIELCNWRWIIRATYTWTRGVVGPLPKVITPNRPEGDRLLETPLSVSVFGWFTRTAEINLTQKLIHESWGPAFWSGKYILDAFGGRSRVRFQVQLVTEFWAVRKGYDLKLVAFCFS